MRAIAALIERYDTLLIEDDPYCDLRYEGHALPPIKSMAPEHVVYVGTLSKVLAPGLRIGFCVAPEPIRNWLVLVKQGVDLHTSTFNQALAAEYLEGGHLQRRGLRAGEAGLARAARERGQGGAPDRRERQRLVVDVQLDMPVPQQHPPPARRTASTREAIP